MKIHFFRSLVSIFLFLPFSSVHAAVYDQNTLQIYSKIIPRLVLMSNLATKEKASVSICTVHDDGDGSVAERFSEMIQKNVSGGSVAFDIRHCTYEHASECFESQLLFVLNGSEEQFLQLRKSLEGKQVITVAYDPRMLESGADISLYMGRSVMPYLNLSALRDKGIRLESVLLRVSKVYEGNQP